MKHVLVAASLLASTALAYDREQAAIDYLWSLDEPEFFGQVEDVLHSEFARNVFIPLSGPTMSPEDWFQNRPPNKPFEFRVRNQLAPFDGFHFIISQMTCSVDYINRIGAPAGSFSENQKYHTRRNQTATWKAEGGKCVNTWGCIVEVVIDGLNDPDAARMFGPYGQTNPNKTDCYEYAETTFSFD